MTDNTSAFSIAGTTRYERALSWLRAGVDLVPMRSRSKRLIKGYGAYSKHITTPAQVRFWFGKLTCNLGIVCGGERGLVCVDFDDEKRFLQWRDGAGHDLVTLIEKTRRGFHVYVIAPGIAEWSCQGLEVKTRQIVMVAPSIHPDGDVYRVVTDAPVAQVSRDDFLSLFPFVSEMPQQAVRSNDQSAPMLRPTVGGTVVSRIKSSVLVSTEARRVTALKGHDGHYSGLCPFHDDHNPSLWIDDIKGLWGCYSPACPTNQSGAKVHDVINFRAMASGITIQQAIGELAREFLMPY